MEQKHDISGAAAKKQPAPVPTGAKPTGSVARYIDKTVDFDGLAGDIQTLVTQRLEQSIPDEKLLMMDLATQVQQLTGEVKELRKQLEAKPYSVYTCPSGQMQDISEELAVIKRILLEEPSPRRQVTDGQSFGGMPRRTAALPQAQPQITQQTRQTAQPQAAARSAIAWPDEPLTRPAAPTRPAAGADIRWPETAPPKPTAINWPDEPTRPPAAAAPPPTTQPEELPSRGHTGAKPKANKSRVWSVVGNVLFYVAIVGIVLGAFLAKSGSGGQPTVIGGYSAFTVLSSSMEDTYPKGALIVTHSVDANELQVGDDITFMASATSSITHRIVGITENYLNTGARAFETQGTMNASPDKEPVAAANVVGKVIFCSVVLGRAATFVHANWPIMLFFAAVIGALVAFLKWNFRREEDPQPKETKYSKNQKQNSDPKIFISEERRRKQNRAR